MKKPVVKGRRRGDSNPQGCLARRISSASNERLQGPTRADEPRKDTASGSKGIERGKISADLERRPRPDSLTSNARNRESWGRSCGLCESGGTNDPDHCALGVFRTESWHLSARTGPAASLFLTQIDRCCPFRNGWRGLLLTWRCD